MRIVAFAIAVGACSKPPPPKAPAPPAPQASTIDQFTSLRCEPLDQPEASLIECAPAGGECSLAYTATRITTNPSGYEVGDQVPIEATASAWRTIDDGEHLHVELVGSNVIVDAQLEGGWGTEATVGHTFVGVARTIGADAPTMHAVSIADAPHTPTTTRDELRIGVRCALSTDLQE